MSLVTTCLSLQRLANDNQSKFFLLNLHLKQNFMLGMDAAAAAMLYPRFFGVNNMNPSPPFNFVRTICSVRLTITILVCQSMFFLVFP